MGVSSLLPYSGALAVFSPGSHAAISRTQFQSNAHLPFSTCHTWILQRGSLAVAFLQRLEKRTSTRSDPSKMADDFCSSDLVLPDEESAMPRKVPRSMAMVVEMSEVDRIKSKQAVKNLRDTKVIKRLTGQFSKWWSTSEHCHRTTSRSSWLIEMRWY